ncbi:hypothetical protein PoB_000706700 [Plakobranchus ocellatus]|uniref:Uncharacterized protein n=1 Tax=Plakobranchus ocellatus TaxID=259542 RepID=A0AAV3YDM5_9GAST|nr:hypothetical protein PoB_000706700 [Plakobranchus ocellatus]
MATSAVSFLLILPLITPIWGSANVTQNIFKFKILTGVVVESGSIQIQKVKREEMSLVLCATYCNNACGMFAVNNVESECITYSDRAYEVGLITTGPVNWKLGYRTDYDTVSTNEWTLVFRAQKKIGFSVFDAWNRTGEYDDHPIQHSFPLECLQVAFIEFNGTGSDRDSWFTQERILNSTWSPGLNNESSLPDMGVAGYYVEGSAARRFNIYGPRVTCGLEWLYTTVLDHLDDICDHDWDIDPVSFPNFLYSTTNGRAAVKGAIYPLVDLADVLAVWVKFET